MTNEPSADNWSENDQLLPSDPAQPNGSFQGCNGHLCRRDDRVDWADTKHDFCLKASSNGTVEFDCIPHRAECIDDWARTGSVFRRTRPICAEETRRDGRHFHAEPGDSLRQYFGNSFKCEFAAAVVSDTRHRKRRLSMNEQIKEKILALLDQHRIMTLATLRPDGWPQATTVGYVNEGLTLYFPLWSGKSEGSQSGRR